MADARRLSRVRAEAAAAPAFALAAGSATVRGAAQDPEAAAFARGLEQGRAEGRLEAERSFEAERTAGAQRLGEALVRLAAVEEETLHRHEAQLLEIALAAAARVVRERLADGDPIAVRALREALDALPATTAARASLHPADLEAVARELAAEIDRGRLTIVADPAVGRGGCTLDSAVGTVVATIEAAQAAVRSAARADGASS